ncbi:MAG: hypothetical protein JXM73_14930 [Anaerolineae bacterium]|nr:hypothetical protein [Anaerolineae bacterium]
MMKHRSLFVLLAALALLTFVALSPGLAAPLPDAAGNPAPAAVSFTLTRLTGNSAEDTRPTLAVDGNGQAHVAYEHGGDIYTPPMPAARGSRLPFPPTRPTSTGRPSPWMAAARPTSPTGSLVTAIAII